MTEEIYSEIAIDKTWQKFTDAESVVLESKKMQISEAKHIYKDFNEPTSACINAKDIAQDTFNATWNTKEESGWVI